MIYPQLHFTGQVWRPPYEAGSQLLQITSGCTWHKCKFCSLYHGTPFRMSPLSEVEEDLKVIRQWQPRARRVYLTGANPFALSYNRLMDVALLLRKYLPHLVSFGMFARVTDIAPKSVEELKNLRHMKLDSINIGIETAHNETLDRMNKGYHASDILVQLSKLDEAGIRYNLDNIEIFYHLLGQKAFRQFYIRILFHRFSIADFIFRKGTIFISLTQVFYYAPNSMANGWQETLPEGHEKTSELSDSLRF